MEKAAKQSLNGKESETLQFSTNAKEELGQNNSGGSQSGNSDQGVVSAAAAAKALGKRKFEDFIDDEQITDEQQEATHIEANQGKEFARENLTGLELPECSQKKKRCMIQPASAKHESESEKAKKFQEAIVELVRLATEELRVMAVVTEPLWRYCGADDGSRILDKVAYRRIFPNLVGPMQVGFESEASRGTARVKLSPKHLVNILMDVSQWSIMFYEIVSMGTTIKVLMNPGGATNYDGTIQLMNARYQLSTPLVNIRQTYFARYCRRYSENDWLVVDVSLDGGHQVPGMWCKKRPSGCLIHGLSDEFSQITWLEHVEADYRGVSPMYQNLLVSGVGFGAKRWLSILERRSQQMGAGISLRGYNQLVVSSDEGARNVLLKLAARMVCHFHSGISGITGNWRKLSGPSTTDNVRVLIRRNMIDRSLPRGTLVSAASSIWLPVPPKSVFEFLRDHNSRSEPLVPYTGRELEVLSDANAVEPVCHISKGQEAIYCVSIHNVLAENSQENILLLQESCSDPVASYIVYSRLRTEDMNLILTGRSSEYRPLLPSGFAVHPDGTSGGAFLTISFQLLVQGSPMPDEMNTRVRNLTNRTTDRLRVALEEYISQVALLASLNWAS